MAMNVGRSPTGRYKTPQTRGGDWASREVGFEPQQHQCGTWEKSRELVKKKKKKKGLC